MKKMRSRIVRVAVWHKLRGDLGSASTPEEGRLEKLRPRFEVVSEKKIVDMRTVQRV